MAESKSTGRNTPAKKSAKPKVAGRVVEDASPGYVAVYPASKSDYVELAKQLLDAAGAPSEVVTRSSPRRFVVSQKLAKQAGIV